MNIKCQICTNKVKEKTRKFCSIECYSISKRATYTKACPTCKNNFILKNKAYERRGGGKFCSRKCASKNLQYDFNERYFDGIDTPEKAYWLGFLLADGYNSNKEIILHTSYKDIDHLEKFKKSINLDRSIKINIEKEIYLSCVLRIGSVHMCKTLEKLGCIKNKSYDVEIPKNIQKELEVHLIRGIFDGDGCFYHKGKNKDFSIYSESPVFREQINKIFHDNNINTRVYRKTIVCKKREEIVKIYNWLYNNSTIHLDRKKEKFEKYFEELRQVE